MGRGMIVFIVAFPSPPFMVPGSLPGRSSGWCYCLLRAYMLFFYSVGVFFNCRKWHWFLSLRVWAGPRPPPIIAISFDFGGSSCQTLFSCFLVVYVFSPRAAIGGDLPPCLTETAAAESYPAILICVWCLGYLDVSLTF